MSLNRRMDAQRVVVLLCTRTLATLPVPFVSFRTPTCMEGPFLSVRIVSREANVEEEEELDVDSVEKEEVLDVDAVKEEEELAVDSVVKEEEKLKLQVQVETGVNCSLATFPTTLPGRSSKTTSASAVMSNMLRSLKDLVEGRRALELLDSSMPRMLAALSRAWMELSSRDVN